ncbi:probable palmitoyltransferase PFA3 [Rhynchosporium agropyri]|uniref:Palmitoyltransferase n=1 Tax=Rhynchosporium agropyri TaxID=914238 RepID=A0A1E1LD13_9HELO|nr:probable palmitoyltransferase PFA3 [Rhynchosporium agropyri]
MTTLAPPSPPRSPTRMSRRWARKCERYCCIGATYFPLLFVYSLTGWAVWVEATIGFLQAKRTGTSLLGITLFILLNWSYTTAVFTSPGTTTGNTGYSSLPTNAPPAATSFTVKSNGELRFCKKCQARKPDRAHHCSTCKTCVLKMDHHCPWLANCVGLRNYKAFLLFLIYTTLFCFVDFAVSGYWVYREILTEGEYTDALMPVNYVMLAVISGIIGLVLAGFTGWHLILASRGQTTIECLETTRYLSPLRKQHQPLSQANYEQQQREMNGVPDQHQGDQGQRHESYDALERFRARERYEEYLDEQDSEKLPSAFDLGWKRNLQHLFGPSKLLWFFPICNTTGDGWSWEASPKWLQARETIAQEREEQQQREYAAGWGAEPSLQAPPVREGPGAGRHYVSYPSRTQSKADRLLGRNPDDYTDDSSVQMETLRSRDPEDQYDISSDEDEADRRALDRKATHGWPQRVGVVTNTLLGNTIARQKDGERGWDDIDDGVD